MSNNRKGVSPIIAVVILIAVAVSIGIMVTTWVTHWVTTQTGSDEITCSIDTNYVIASAKFDSAANINNLLIKVTNKGEKGLYGFGVVMDNASNVFQVNSSGLLINPHDFFTSNITLTVAPNVTSTNTLGQEQSVYITVLLNVTNAATTDSWLIGFGKTLTEIRITNKACPSIAPGTTTITQT